MEKLKTLKDLDFPAMTGKTEARLVSTQLLRQEAIRWDKNLANDEFKFMVWRRFFNITEEDLE